MILRKLNNEKASVLVEFAVSFSLFITLFAGALGVTLAIRDKTVLNELSSLTSRYAGLVPFVNAYTNSAATIAEATELGIINSNNPNGHLDLPNISSVQSAVKALIDDWILLTGKDPAEFKYCIKILKKQSASLVEIPVIAVSVKYEKETVNILSEFFSPSCFTSYSPMKILGASLITDLVDNGQFSDICQGVEEPTLCGKESNLGS